MQGFHPVPAQLALQPGGPQQTGREQAEQDHEEARGEVQRLAMGEQGEAERARPRAERDEDGREPEHEAEAQAERAQAVAPAGSRLARDVGHVARDEGQHAGRQERHGAGREGRHEAHA